MAPAWRTSFCGSIASWSSSSEKQKYHLPSLPCDSEQLSSRKTVQRYDAIMRLKAEAFNRTFQSQMYENYKAAAFFNSSVIARLMKSLIVVPLVATNAATRE